MLNNAMQNKYVVQVINWNENICGLNYTQTYGYSTVLKTFTLNLKNGSNI